MKDETSDFQKLRADVVAAGGFDYRPWRAIAAMLLNLAAALAAFVLSARGGAWLLLFPVGSLLFYRLGWFMHDGAHGGVFGKPLPDRLFTLFTCLVMGEFASGWSYGHNRHHAGPNVRGLDGDQSERWNPAFRFRTKAGAAFALFLFSRVGRVWLPKTLALLALRDGVYAFRHKRDRFALELAVVLVSHTWQLVFFSTLFGIFGPLLWLLNTHFGMVYLNAVFAGNHYDLPSFDLGEHKQVDFAKLQIITSRNYVGPLMHFACGGLEHQIEHHLFPNLPRHGVWKAEPLVRAYCERRGLPYEERSLWGALDRVLAFHVRPDAPGATAASAQG